MSPAIRIENLSKRYVVSHEGKPRGYQTLRESLVDMASAPLRRLRGEVRVRNEEFWALKNVEFDVQQGEAIGVIGHNGAGKSTLLKVLSRITKPTGGKIRINGRIGSLLEVGTGFHPELTGRENVFLNGGILGMSRKEVAGRFDEIVNFAGVEKFLDTPVKRYSSGMYVRLAFAVAAHLEPEVLIVDEVLAVGDATFQRKCIDHMNKLVRGGRTVLFVSHNMQLIPQLCTKGVVLERGCVANIGEAHQVVEEYISKRNSAIQNGEVFGSSRSGTGEARFESIELLSANGEVVKDVSSGADLFFKISIRAKKHIENAALSLVIKSVNGNKIASAWTKDLDMDVSLTPGVQKFICTINSLSLRPGHVFSVNLWLAVDSSIDAVEDAMFFGVLPSGRSSVSTNADQGPVLVDFRWSQI